MENEFKFVLKDVKYFTNTKRKAEAPTIESFEPQAKRKPLQSIKEALIGKNPYAKDDPRKQELNQAVVKFIVKRHEPLSIVDDEDFVSMLSAFDNR